MPERPETLELMRPGWPEPIVLRLDNRKRAWQRLDDDKGRVSVLATTRSSWRGAAEVRPGDPWLTTYSYTTPQAAADALAERIETTPELRHLRPGGGA